MPDAYATQWFRRTECYTKKCAPVAQLDRAFGYEPKGRMFESCRAHHPFARHNGCVNLSRRGFLASSALGCFGQTRTRPNVILVMTDDQGYGDLHCHGNRFIRTPHLDRLHQQTVRFTNYHVSPTCSPTRSALLTGRYANATGVWHTIMGRSLLRPGEVTAGDCFRAGGYRTGVFGKWHLGDNHPCRPMDRGFDESLVHGGGGIWQTPDRFGNDYEDDVFLRNGKPERSRGYCTNVWFTETLRFIDGARKARQPFFCYLSTNAPHSPMWAPRGYEERYRNVAGLAEPGFYGMIENIDENVGRLLDFLKKNALEENTLLIFTTDNGTAAGSRVFNAGMRGAKGSPYDGGHRVPLFVRWPARGVGGGRDAAALAAHIDVLPTLLDVCDLPRPQGPPVHGRSLAPLLFGEAGEWPERTIVTDSQRLENLVKWRQAAVMTGQWRLVNPSPDGDPSRCELYDAAADPGQQSDVASAQPSVVRTLKAEYDRWWSEVSRDSDQPVRITIGHPSANPVRLTAHDWHSEGAERAWNQKQIREAPVANGYWTLDVVRAGTYRFALRRWPPELDLAINAPYRDAKPNRETTPGRAVDVSLARISVGSATESKQVARDDKAAVFDLPLPTGPADVRTWFSGHDGTERGAYFVEVELR
jgi:arylsulfatase A-like enzyme